METCRALSRYKGRQIAEYQAIRLLAARSVAVVVYGKAVRDRPRQSGTGLRKMPESLAFQLLNRPQVLGIDRGTTEQVGEDRGGRRVAQCVFDGPGIDRIDHSIIIDVAWQNVEPADVIREAAPAILIVTRSGLVIDPTRSIVYVSSELLITNDRRCVPLRPVRVTSAEVSVTGSSKVICNLSMPNQGKSVFRPAGSRRRPSEAVSSAAVPAVPSRRTQR